MAQTANLVWGCTLHTSFHNYKQSTGREAQLEVQLSIFYKDLQTH